MGLGRQFQSLALVLFLVVSFINSSHSRHLSIKRHKRQHGADLYLPGSYVIPGGEGDPNEHWGPWGSPSECSRSCGGGVAYQTRECYDVGHDGSPRCRGSDKKFFSCNTQDCPETDVDFRQQQCSHFDNVPFEGVRYEWVPYLKAPNPCELNCMPRGERFYYRHKAKVIDGTRCNEESLDVCVDGTCQSVGCDMMLGSSSKEDKCRKCAGDGSSCKTVEGLLDMDNLQVGYNDILLIPAGATNIEIKEIAPSNNYLAIRNLLAHYYLNGNWRIDFPRPMNYAGGIWHYERKPQGFAAPDHLTCMGPTTEPLYLVLLYQDRNVGIHYEYSVPEGSARLREPDSYDWTFGPYSECSAKCGGGFQIRNVTCNSRTTLEQVDESLCDSTKKMEEVKKCGQDKCPPRWVESPWGKCSAPCGNEGKQERDVTCEQVSAFGVVTKVKDSICLDSVGNKPATVQECNVGIVCPQWHIGSWQPCNKLCGPGSQKRQVKCYRKVDGKITVLDDADCVEVRPESTKECIQRPCEGVDWITSPWTGCKSCGLTAESRTVLCASKDGKVYNETFCANRKLPELERPCTSTTACKYQWFTSQWSKCSAECGKGVQTRTIVCGLFDGEFVKRADDESKCEVKEKPNEQRDCSAEKECPGQWFTGPWSECSVPCGGGRKTRKVLCLANNKAVPVTECTEEAVIFSSEDCNPDPCVDDETIPVDSTSKPILEDDEGEEYCDEDEEEDGEELDKMNSTGDDGSGSTSDAFDLNVRTTHSMLITDELMQSDATGYESDIAVSESATDLPTPTTVEGSGDDDISIHERFNLEEGSGEPHELKDIAQTPVPGAADDDYEDENGEEDEDEDEYSTASTESSTSDSTTDTTESTSTDTTDTTESSSSISTDTTESSSSISTDTTESSSSFATDTTESSSSLATDTTESSTSISTETTESSSSVSTESTESSSSVSTDTTESSSSVSTDTTESSTSVSTDTTESSSSVSTDTTESSSSISTETTESSSSVSTDTTESSSSVSTETTESSSSVSTDTTEFSSSISTDTTESSSSISTDTTESSSSVSTDTTESSSSISTDTTESSSSISTETTESSTPISTETTESSTPISTETTESSSSISTETTESSSPISTETTESSSTISTETTESSSSISTETTESSSPISTETTESLSSISTETTESSSSISTETTESSSSIATETTESSSSISTETTESSSSISTETTESSSSISTETTESSSSISTETTESTSSASTETTESPATDTTETGTEEIESRFGVTEVDVDIWSTISGSEATEGSTSYTLEDVIRKETTPRKCKPRPKKPVCLKSPFGCCADNVTSAKGPFDEGCPSPKTCKETKHGCCPDKVSPAKGPKNKGCPKPLCDEGLFGCCPDGITEAEGEDEEGCPIIVTTTTAGGCEAGKYGCCPDGESEATGPNNEGCEEGSTTECEGEACIFTTTSESTSEETETEESVSETTTEAEDKGCARSTYGCCPDGVSEATGENYHGCEEECESSPHGCCADRRTPAKGPNMEGCSECLSDIFGCCRDGKTPAHGPNGEGCCLQSAFGCCPDNLNEAQGPNLEGCGCEYSSYGCCPDNKTIAKGHDNLGCGCELTKFGCCLDKVTPAPDENLKGCPCHTFQFGCCPDGITVPSGPHNYGCHCSHSEFKCCSDEVTPATGPNYEGCSCATSKFGCCPDGVTEAQGKNFDDCRDVPTVPQKACSLKRDGGTCNNFTVKSFYDTEYGGCSRFWYGGCDGNDNRFETIDECKAVCEDPVGKDACLLPKVHGPCTGYSPMWYFDNDRNQCTQFIYGGCLGNNNRFETLEDCKNICVPDESIPACEQPVDEGPCQGSYERWYFDIDSDICRPFNYGGCKGNKNNYQTEHACNYNCKTPGVQRESCTLPESKGECEHVQARWFFSNKDNKCMPFYYSGCGGNHNKYYTEEECERSCPVLVERDLCALPAEVGDCQNYTARWYFDTRESRCRQFYYGGCGGNKNNFNHEDDCLSRCEKKEEVQPEEPVRPEEPRTPEEPERFSTDFCFLPSHQGDCNSYEGRWYYNSYEGVCEQFTYTGCGGNQNNFPTYDECEQHCGSVQETCSLPPVRGHCNENIQRWYYDERSDRCHQFDYGGCRGNTNNFYTERDCLNACKVPPPTDERTHAPPHVEPPRHEVSICDEPLDHGDCDADEVKYFYNRETASCEGFEYTGCGGNGNRFESLEQCDRQCGEYRGVDVCNQPVEIGPCDQYQVRYYYNSESRRCLAFHYSGCEGTGNRFTSMDECESICITHEEPVVDNKAICFLPAETGNCSTYQDFHRRYFYDDSRGTCMPFIYSGCAGNQNNFRSFDSCIAFCHQEPEPEPEPEQPTEYHHTPEPPVAHSPRPTDHCRSYNEACDNLYCNYGIESSYTEDGCMICTCEDPCSKVSCPRYAQCSVEIAYDLDKETGFVGVCVDKNKPGECPRLRNNTLCERECETDADCRGEKKCCVAGCGFVCVLPEVPESTQAPVEQPRPYPHHPGAIAPTLEERLPEDINIDAHEGGYAVLRCYATGYPPPTVTWQRGAIVLNTNQGRYFVTSNGDLQIVQLHRTDSGIYVCIADNGVGAPVSRTVELEVRDPVELDGNAYILGEPNATIIATLKQPITLRCLAGGYPKPYVSWWRGNDLLPLISPHFEFGRDYSLILKQVELSDLGRYTCQAYTGRGRPVSITITLNALGPVHAKNKDDEKYLEFVVNPPVAPTHTPETPYIPRPLPPVVVPVEEEKIPASARLRLPGGNVYNPGSEIVIECETDGYPLPNVTWYKNNREIVESKHVQLLDSHRLSIYGAKSEDSGYYKCEARNHHSHSSHEERIEIEGVEVPPDCVDNQHYADCGKIVKGRYCGNPYYFRFCCRSCTLDGQAGPNLVL